MKFFDIFFVDVLNVVFNCCLEIFDVKWEKKIMKFLILIIQDLFGRILFQLVLFMSCKCLFGDELEKLVVSEVDL